MPDTIVIAGITLTNYEASMMARALREQRKTMTEEEIIDSTAPLMPMTYPDRRERARQIIADLDEKVNNRAYADG